MIKHYMVTSKIDYQDSSKSADVSAWLSTGFFWAFNRLSIILSLKLQLLCCSFKLKIMLAHFCQSSPFCQLVVCFFTCNVHKIGLKNGVLKRNMSDRSGIKSTWIKENWHYHRSTFLVDIWFSFLILFYLCPSLTCPLFLLRLLPLWQRTNQCIQPKQFWYHNGFKKKRRGADLNNIHSGIIKTIYFKDTTKECIQDRSSTLIITVTIITKKAGIWTRIR